METEPEIFEWYSATKQVEDFFVREFGRDHSSFERMVLLPIYGKKIVGKEYRATVDQMRR